MYSALRNVAVVRLVEVFGDEEFTTNQAARRALGGDAILANKLMGELAADGYAQGRKEKSDRSEKGRWVWRMAKDQAESCRRDALRALQNGHAPASSPSQVQAPAQTQIDQQVEEPKPEVEVKKKLKLSDALREAGKKGILASEIGRRWRIPEDQLMDKFLQLRDRNRAAEIDLGGDLQRKNYGGEGWRWVVVPG